MHVFIFLRIEQEKLADFGTINSNKNQEVNNEGNILISFQKQK